MPVAATLFLWCDLRSCSCRWRSINCQKHLTTTERRLLSSRFASLCTAHQASLLYCRQTEMHCAQHASHVEQACCSILASTIISFSVTQLASNNACNLQIKLLRVLGHLGSSDKQASDNMYTVVADSMRRGNTGHTIGNAIVYEAVRTIASIYPNPSLLQSGGVNLLSC